jgi:predicted nucleic acid-binding protein
VFLKVAVEELDSEQVRELWAEWARASVELVAPTLLFYEVASSLRKKIVREGFTPDEAESSLHYLLDQPVRLVSSPSLHYRALTLSTQFGRPNTYDSHYLALAEELDCEFWTADGRLYNAVHRRFPRIRLATSA